MTENETKLREQLDAQRTINAQLIQEASKFEEDLTAALVAMAQELSMPPPPQLAPSHVHGLPAPSSLPDAQPPLQQPQHRDAPLDSTAAASLVPAAGEPLIVEASLAPTEAA